MTLATVTPSHKGLIVCCVVQCVYILFGEIKFIDCCRFIYSEGLLFVLEVCYITRHSFNVNVICHFVNELRRFLILQITRTAPTGYKQVRYLEWIHIIYGAKAPNQRMAEILCLLHHEQAATECLAL